MKKRVSTFLTILMIISVVFSNITYVQAATRTITCSTAAEIHAAFKDAQPGDTIIIKAGTYTGTKSTSGYSNAYFYLNKSGTSDNPIIVQAESASNKPILKGTTVDSGYVFYLIGDNVKIKNLKIETGAQGLMADKSNNNTIYGCEISNIGQEGLHIRDGSTKNVIDSCTIYNTGRVNPGYGEGIYIGSDKAKWTSLAKECDNNKVKRSTLGPNVTAEHIDIKEGTTGTIIEDSTFRGTGISGDNYADSFIDVKGNKALITGNVFYRENNNIIADGIQTHQQEAGWGIGTIVSDNTFHMDASNAYVVNSVTVGTTVSNNIRIPEGNMYRGVILQQ